MKLAFVGVAVGLLLWLKRERAQHRWVRARTVREIHRSLTATADLSRLTGEAAGAFVPSAIWAMFRRLREPLVAFHAAAAKADTERKGLGEAIAAYRLSRLVLRPNYWQLDKKTLSQREYHLVAAQHAEHVHHWVQRTFWTATILLVACAGLGVLLPAWGVDAHATSNQLAKLGTVLLPVVVATLLVLPNLHDHHRRLTVSPSLQNLLKRFEDEVLAIEAMLAAARAGQAVALPCAAGAATTPVAVWAGPPGEQTKLAEAWAANRLAAIAATVENALLTELIGFKTFVESVEVG